ncbi:hypothetical protein GQ600_19616 [Phytophthora cactorum]|nr:hypothetical protein GQ600_19616 [Phytophthora cactorum]
MMEGSHISWNRMCRTLSVQTPQTLHLLSKDDSVVSVLVRVTLVISTHAHSVCLCVGVIHACNPAEPKIIFEKTLGGFLQKAGIANNYGTHSVRKTRDNMCLWGSTGERSIDRYFRYESAGVQDLGHVAAGLPVNDSKFVVIILRARSSHVLQ